MELFKSLFYWLTISAASVQIMRLSPVEENVLICETSIMVHCPNKWTLEFCIFISSVSFRGYVVDVGAAFGYEIDVSRQLNYPVIGIECRHSEYARLRKRYDSDTNITMIHACVSSSAGLLKLHMGEDSSSVHASAMQSVKWKSRRERHPVEYVPSLRIDDIRQTMGIRIGLLKIDVQGHEFHVLKGALLTLREDNPMLFFECASEFNCKNGDDYIRKLNLTDRYKCTCKENCACYNYSVQRLTKNKITM